MERNPPGTAYVYFNYGVHWMFNVLIKGGPADGLILIRAVEPIDGIELMRQRRAQHPLRALCSGPGKLTQAFGILGTDHEHDLCRGKLGFRPGAAAVEVETDTRIGISRAAALPWRFLKKGSPYVSVPPGRRKSSGRSE